MTPYYCLIGFAVLQSQHVKNIKLDCNFRACWDGIVKTHAFHHMFLGEMAAARGVDRTAELPVRIELPDWASHEAVVLLLSNVYSGGGINLGFLQLSRSF